MFFFIAGIQPRTVNLADPPRMCPRCGLNQVQSKRVDHYFSVFFLPIFRVRKGSPFFECGSCGSLSKESGEAWPGPIEEAGRTCPGCGKPLEKGFRFCPFCGRPT